MWKETEMMRNYHNLIVQKTAELNKNSETMRLILARDINMKKVCTKIALKSCDEQRMREEFQQDCLKNSTIGYSRNSE